jgi:hypothetical protein
VYEAMAPAEYALMLQPELFQFGASVAEKNVTANAVVPLKRV